MHDIICDGLHPTTVSCMEAMQVLKEQYSFSHMLDMGCGSGILAVLAAHWWQAEVLAVDISAQAVTDTQALAKAQGMQERVRVLRSDGFSEASITQGAPYDLIIFNLLAEKLVQLAPEVKRHCAPGGICILSGILSWLEADVIRAYEMLGFTLLQRISREPWHTLVWKLPNNI